MKKRLSALLLILTLVCSSMSVFAAPKTMPDGGTFDPEFYAAMYPDVVAAFGTNETLLYQHYMLAGRVEGRLPFAEGTAALASTVMTMPDGGLFDPVFYAATYPDVAAVFGSDVNLLYQHYLLAGKAQGRLPYLGASEDKEAVHTKSVPVSYQGYGPGVSTIQLSAGNLSACYKLMRTDGSLAMEVLLAPNTKTTRTFPSGTYILKSAEGPHWISESQAFGPSGIYSQSISYTFAADYDYEIVSSTSHGDFNSDTMAGFVQ